MRLGLGVCSFQKIEVSSETPNLTISYYIEFYMKGSNLGSSPNHGFMSYHHCQDSAVT